jgi:hypothetical protein
MPWHDESPWAAKNREQDRMAKDRIALIRDALRAFDEGRINSVKTLVRIEEITTDRVVRVGREHTPEVQT